MKTQSMNRMLQWSCGLLMTLPMVAGAAEDIDSTQIRDQIVGTAQDVTSVESGAGWDRYTGYGMVDAAAAVGGGSPVSSPSISSSAAASRSPATISWTRSGASPPTRPTARSIISS